ncbi:hypothetical protein BH11BAC7_BH11BAC7_25500 [soil metagenome]
MQFEIFPTLAIMAELYRQPLSTERFKNYLQLLQGNSKDDLVFPAGGFNPMAKEHALVKLKELQKNGAEEIATDVLNGLNKKLQKENDEVFKVALNLSDDLQGGWTNRFTSDYDSKFKINALVRRKFCTPIFWTGEEFSEELIRTRVSHYCYRTLYRTNHSAPETLQAHIEMEKFVVKESGRKEVKLLNDFDFINAFYQQQKENNEYNLVFNFLYGDEACKSLEFPAYGIKAPMAGFSFAAELAEN